MTPERHHSTLQAGRRVRRGFSFVEILFAVMILGIGFIMVAGIFPVAISQTQASGDDTIAAAAARGGVAYLSKIPFAQLIADKQAMADGQVHAISPNGGGAYDALLWALVRDNLILPEDPRYAWVPLYRRSRDGFDRAEDYGQVIVIVVRAPNGAAYGPMDLQGTPPNLTAKPVNFSITPSVTDPDIITFSGDSATLAAIASGTFVVIANDTSGQPTQNANGWILRVGNPLGGATWQLLPGNDTKGFEYKPTGGKAFIVGQRSASGAGPAGGAQDVAAYSSFIRLQ